MRVLPFALMATSCALTAALSTRARTFMREHGLIKDGDEFIDTSLGVVLRWFAARSVPIEGTEDCALVMSVGTDGIQFDYPWAR